MDLAIADRMPNPGQKLKNEKNEKKFRESGKDTTERVKFWSQN